MAIRVPGREEEPVRDLSQAEATPVDHPKSGDFLVVNRSLRRPHPPARRIPSRRDTTSSDRQIRNTKVIRVEVALRGGAPDVV